MNIILTKEQFEELIYLTYDMGQRSPNDTIDIVGTKYRDNVFFDITENNSGNKYLTPQYKAEHEKVNNHTGSGVTQNLTH